MHKHVRQIINANSIFSEKKIPWPVVPQVPAAVLVPYPQNLLSELEGFPDLIKLVVDVSLNLFVIYFLSMIKLIQMIFVNISLTE